jgi:hypothetical protein
MYSFFLVQQSLKHYSNISKHKLMLLDVNVRSLRRYFKLNIFSEN